MTLRAIGSQHPRMTLGGLGMPRPLTKSKMLQMILGVLGTLRKRPRRRRLARKVHLAILRPSRHLAGRIIDFAKSLAPYLHRMPLLWSCI